MRPHLTLVQLLTIFIIFSMIFPTFSKANSDERLMENDLVTVSVAKALEIANSKARELDFKIENFYLSITDELNNDDERFFSITEKKYSVWKIYYGPKNKLSFGGDLTIYVDRETWKILKVWEGE